MSKRRGFESENCSSGLCGWKPRSGLNRKGILHPPLKKKKNLDPSIQNQCTFSDLGICERERERVSLNFSQSSKEVVFSLPTDRVVGLNNDAPYFTTGSRSC